MIGTWFEKNGADCSETASPSSLYEMKALKRHRASRLSVFAAIFGKEYTAESAAGYFVRKRGIHVALYGAFQQQPAEI